MAQIRIVIDCGVDSEDLAEAGVRANELVDGFLGRLSELGLVRPYRRDVTVPLDADAATEEMLGGYRNERRAH